MPPEVDKHGQPLTCSDGPDQSKAELFPPAVYESFVTTRVGVTLRVTANRPGHGVLLVGERDGKQFARFAVTSDVLPWLVDTLKAVAQHAKV